MVLPTKDLVLVIVTLLFIVVDIVLALCLKLALPKHVTTTGWYPADGNSYTFEEAVEYCPCLQRVFPEGVKEKIKFDKVSTKALAKRHVKAMTYPQRKYPFVVSLITRTVENEEVKKKFVCNGLIEARNWIITSKSCVKNYADWFSLTVQSNSSFWAFCHQRHAVIDVSEFGDLNLMRLKVFPPFSEKLVPKPKLTFPKNANWTYAVSLGWNTSTPAYFQEFTIKEWTSVPTNSTLTDLCTNTFSKNMQSLGNFLITSCRQVVGIELMGQNKFVSIHSNTESNGCDQIYKDDHVPNAPEVCKWNAQSFELGSI